MSLRRCLCLQVVEADKPVWQGGKFVAGVEGVTGAELKKSRSGKEMHVAVVISGGGRYAFSAVCA